MKHIGESCKDASDGVIERLRVVTENDIEDFLRILVEGFDVVIFSIGFREGHMNRAHVGVCAAGNFDDNTDISELLSNFVVCTDVRSESRFNFIDKSGEFRVIREYWIFRCIHS